MKTENTAVRLAARPVLAAAVLLMVPLVAMQFTDEVVWTLSDFVIMGALIVGIGVMYELAAMRTKNTAYRFAAGIALAAAFFLLWLMGAVGIIGASGDRADLMYVGVLAVGLIGAIIARFQPLGMARALFATAIAQASVGVIALIAGMVPAYNSPYEILGLTGIFVALFLGSALLFRQSARKSRAVAGREG